MQVLVFAPHPDDDVIGCGGSIAKLAQAGHEITVVYLTSGDAGSLKFSRSRLGPHREREARRAARHLGVGRQHFLRVRDGEVDFDRRILLRLMRLVRRIRPQRVYLPHAREAHRDHAATHELAVEALRRTAGPWHPEAPGGPWSVETVLGYEVWTPIEQVSFAEDVTAHFAAKRKALREHRSQLEDVAYDEAVEGLNRYRAVVAGKGRFCEVFQVLAADSI